MLTVYNHRPHSLRLIQPTRGGMARLSWPRCLAKMPLKYILKYIVKLYCNKFYQSIVETANSQSVIFVYYRELSKRKHAHNLR